jgi:branched-subunit amino acid transport protein
VSEIARGARLVAAGAVAALTRNVLLTIGAGFAVLLLLR